MHFVNHSVPAGHRRRQIFDGDLHVGCLARLLERFLDERVVVGRPKGTDGQRGENLVILRKSGAACEFVDKRLIDLVAAAPFASFA